MRRMGHLYILCSDIIPQQMAIGETAELICSPDYAYGM